MDRPSAWHLNLDAEDELARPAGYTPPRAVLRRCEALADRLRPLLRPGDILLPLESPPVVGPHYIGRAWSPTPRARRMLARAGVTLTPAPSMEVLRSVNHRRLNALVGQTLAGAAYAITLEDVQRALRGPTPTGQYLMKRPFGHTGRGRLKIDPRDPADARHAGPWIKASLRAGEGLQIEPWVQRLADHAIHGHVSSAGAIVLGEPTCQRCDANGAWIETTLAGPADLTLNERAALIGEALKAAEALREAGYFGPFNIDAYRYLGEGGEAHYNPRSEINARYSMGWAVGMGRRRPDLEEPVDAA